MAGIAFRLQKLLSGESYVDLVKAYLYSSVIASGPFLVVIATMSFIQIGVQLRLTLEEGKILTSFIVYAYAFSMLGVAPFIYVVTRYLADKHYLRQVEVFTPTFLSVLEPVFLIQSLAAIFFLQATPIAFTTKVILYCLYLFLSAIWIAMIFLSAARNYLWIVASFAMGGLVSVGASLIFGRGAGMDGFLIGITTGQGVCFLSLSLRIFLEFGYKLSHDYSYLSYFRKHLDLLLVGVFYYAGIWIDKVIFWYTPLGETIVGPLRLYPDYDTPMFWAYVSIIPSMAFFLVQMETSFVRYYYAYFQAIRRRQPLNVIRARRSAMIENLSAQFQKYVIFQGSITGAIILMRVLIFDTFYLDPKLTAVLGIGVLGAFIHMAVIMIVNILFYFDKARDVMWLTLLFLVTNGLFTLATYFIGLPAHGFGYAGACLVTLIAGFFILDYRLKHLDYFTFMEQPIVLPKFKLEAESKTRTT